MEFRLRKLWCQVRDAIAPKLTALAIAPEQSFKFTLELMVRQAILLPEWRCAIAAMAFASILI